MIKFGGHYKKELLTNVRLIGEALLWLRELESVYDRKNDPQGQTDWSDLLIICCTRLNCANIVPHCTDQIQVSLKKCSECSYIIELVSVSNFYIRRYITLEILSNAVLETVYHQDSNTAICKFSVSALGSSQCCVDVFE